MIKLINFAILHSVNEEIMNLIFKIFLGLLLTSNLYAGVCLIDQNVEIDLFDKSQSYKLHEESSKEKIGLNLSKCIKLAKNAANMGLVRAKKELQNSKREIVSAQASYKYSEIDSNVIVGNIKVLNKVERL